MAVDLVVKQFANGVVGSEQQLVYWQQSGALVDSSAIVLATMVKQYYIRQTAKDADWLYGMGILSHIISPG
jgi:Zn-dependent metalloprotease